MIASAISILRYCAAEDKQAERVSFIVETFDQANVSRPATARRLSIPGREVATITTLSQNPLYDPVLNLFRHGSAGGRGSGSGGSPGRRGREHDRDHSSTVIASSMAHLKDRTQSGMGGPALTSISSSMAPLIPTSMSSTLQQQQPSPEGSSSHSVSLSSGMGGGGSGGIHGSNLETMSGGESEIDFDMLWNPWPARGAPTSSAGTGVAIPPPSQQQQQPPPPHPAMHSADSFGSYAATAISQSQAVPSSHPPPPPPLLGNNPSVSVNVPLYPPSHFH